MVLPSDLNPTVRGDVQGTVCFPFLLQTDAAAEAAGVHAVDFVDACVFFEMFL